MSAKLLTATGSRDRKAAQKMFDAWKHFFWANDVLRMLHQLHWDFFISFHQPYIQTESLLPGFMPFCWGQGNKPRGWPGTNLWQLYLLLWPITWTQKNTVPFSQDLDNWMVPVPHPCNSLGCIHLWAWVRPDENRGQIKSLNIVHKSPKSCVFPAPDQIWPVSWVVPLDAIAFQRNFIGDKKGQKKCDCKARTGLSMFKTRNGKRAS